MVLYSGRKRRAAVSVSKGGALTVRNPVYRPRGSGRVMARAGKLSGVMRKAGFFGRYTGPKPELKFLDTTLSFTVDDTAEVPATGQLALIPQGQTQSTRNGRKAFIKQINVHGTVNLIPAAAATSSTVVYLYVMLDTQCNGAAATVSGDTGIFTSANLALANVNLSNSGRFRILKKWVFNLISPGGVSGAYNNVTKAFQFNKWCNIEMEFDAAADTGAITTIRSNNIFLVAGTANTGQDDTVAVQGVARIRFLDN